jgi:hypothetical protein
MLNTSISRRFVGDVISGKKKLDNETCESVKFLKHAKFEDREDALVRPILIGQVNAKSGTVTDEVIKEQAKVLSQQMSVKFSTEKLVFFSKY